MNAERDLEVLFLPRYERLGSSSRLRCYQYLPGLEALGVRGRAVPLLTDAYIKALYSSARLPTASVMRGYFRRVMECLHTGKVDLVWIERELLPWIPELPERVLRSMWKAPYVVDLDDAVFHRYDLHSRPLIRRILGRKVDGLMRRASMVIAGNEYLVSRAIEAGARLVRQLPTTVDTERYHRPRPSRSECATVGWIGSPATVHFLEIVRGAVTAVARRHKLRLLVVGSEIREWSGVHVDNRPWTEETEAALVNEMDIGIMPLYDGPSERGKCGYKLIQYMASSVPVIASPVGVNTEIVQHGLTGYLAATETDWIDALETLIASPELASGMGLRGRALAVEKYSLRCNTVRLAQLLREAAV